MRKIIFELNSNKILARKVSRELGIPLGKCSVKHFADGELLIQTETDVYGLDVYIIQSTAKPAITNIFKTILLVDSLKRRAHARSVHLIVPYFGFSRQERSYGFEPISCQVVANMINHSGIDSVVSLDLHQPVIRDFFTIPMKEICTQELFADYYLKLFKNRGINLDDVCVVAPDHGSNGRAERLKELLGATDIVFLLKIRERANVSETLDLDDQSKEIVKGKYCVIIDDIIDTGGTISHGAEVLYRYGAKEVFVGATHGVFSKNSVDLLTSSGIKDIVVTNTIEKNYPPEVKVLDIKELIKREIIK